MKSMKIKKRKEQDDETDRNNDDSDDVYGKGHVYVLLLHVMLGRSAITYGTKNEA